MNSCCVSLNSWKVDGSGQNSRPARIFPTAPPSACVGNLLAPASASGFLWPPQNFQELGRILFPADLRLWHSLALLGAAWRLAALPGASRRSPAFPGRSPAFPGPIGPGSGGGLSGMALSSKCLLKGERGLQTVRQSKDSSGTWGQRPSLIPPTGNCLGPGWEAVGHCSPGKRP